MNIALSMLHGRVGRATLVVVMLGWLLNGAHPRLGHAADYTWSGTNALWTSSNWVTTSGTTTFPAGSSGTNTAVINTGTVSFAGSDTFGNAATTSSPVIRISTGATLASNGVFNTIWDLNLNGGTLLANGGVNATFPAYQLAGTLLVNGSTASTISAGGGSNNMINVGGQGNATLTFNVADVTSSTAADLTVGVVLQNAQVTGGSQAGSLTKTGAGTLVLSAANTYTGATTVSGGVLQIASGGSLSSAGNINTTGGGVLSIAGGVTMAANTYFAVGTGITNTTGTTTIDGGSLNVGGNAFLIGGGRGDAAAYGVGTFVVNSGTVTVAAAAGTGGGSDTSQVWLNPYGFSGTSSLILNGGVFNTARGIRNGSGGQTAVAFNGGTLRLGANLTDITNSISTISVQSGGAVIDTNGFNGTFSQALATGGGATAGGLTKLGSGTLTLSASNTYTGTTTISGGMLALSGAGNLASTGAVAITGSGAAFNISGASAGRTIGMLTGVGGSTVTLGTNTLTVGNATSGTFAGGIGGTGGLVKQGAGTLALTGSNTYSGSTSITAGTLAVGSGGSLSSAGSVNTTGGGVLSIAGGVTMAANTFFAVGTGITNTTGTTTIDGGSLNVGGNAFLIGGGRGDAAAYGVGTFVVNSGTVTVAAAAGTGGGSDTSQVWLNPYGFSGTSSLILNGGVFNTARGIRNGSGGQTAVAFNGGTLQLGANLTDITNSISTISVQSGGAVIDTNGFNGTFSQALPTGGGATTGGLTKLGSGTLTLSVANTFSGTTRIGAGVLSITNTNGLQNSTLDLNALDSGVVSFSQNSTLGGLAGSWGLDMGTRTLSIGNNNQNTTYSGTLSNGAFTKIGTGTLTLTAPAATSVATTVSAGVLRLSGGNDRLGTSSAITVSGGTLDLGGNSQTTSGAVTFAGLSGLTSGTLTTTNGPNLIPTGTLTLGGNAAFVATLADQRLLLGFGASNALTLTGSAGSSVNFGGNDATRANYVGVDNGSATLVVNGPTVNFQIAAGQANATGGWLRIGANNGTGLVTLTSGTINVGHSASLGAQFQNDPSSSITGSGTLTIAGGAFNVGTGTTTTTAGGDNGYLYLKNDAAGSSGNAIVNLNGGVLSAKRIVPGTGGGTKQLNFNGGTLAAAAYDASFMNAASGFSVNVGNAGGTIDSGAFAITVAAPLLASGTGGITKAGSGALTLTGTSNYTGATTISSGTLILGGAGQLGSGSYAGGIANGGAFVVSTSANQTLSGPMTGVGGLTKSGAGALTLSGSSSFAGGVSLTNGSLLVGSDAALGSGTLSLSNGVTVSSDGATARSLANAVEFGGDATLGDAANSGTLTFTGGIGLGGATRQITTPSNVTFSSAVTNGGLTKTGAGTLTLSAANTYTGLTTVSGGVLNVTGGLADSGTVSVNGGTYRVGTNDTIAALTLVSGVLDGAGTLSAGTATLQSGTVAGKLGGSGGILKSTAGTVAINGLVTAPITVEAGTLAGTGTAGAVSIAAGGNVANGDGNTATLTLGSLTYTGTGALTVNLPAGQFSTPGIALTGNLTTILGAVLTVPTAPGWVWATGSSYSLVSYAGSFNGTTSDFALTPIVGLGARQTPVLNASAPSNGVLTLSIQGDTPVWTGAVSNAWTTAPVDNWELAIGGGPTTFLANDAVAFDDTATTTAVAITTANVGVASVVFTNSSQDYVVTSTGGYGIVDGGVTPATLTKNGSGKVTIATPNSYTGVTTINAGTLQIGDGTTDGSIAGASIVNNATLAYLVTGSQSYAGVISGSGTLSKSGTGTLTLTGSNTFTGATAVSAGTLAVGGGGSLGGGAYAGGIANGGSLVFSTSASQTLSGVISGTGALVKQGAGTLTLSGTNTFTGATTLAAGILRLGSSNALGGGGDVVFTGGTLQFTAGGTPDVSGRVRSSASAMILDTNGQSVAFAGGLAASNTGGLTKQGAGTLTLSGQNVYTGATTITGGTLAIGGSGVLGGGSYSDPIVNGGALSVATSANQTLAGVISGTGTLSKSGAGALTLSGANSLSGGVTLSAGRLNLDNAAALGAGTFTVSGGTIGNTSGSALTLAGGTPQAWNGDFTFAGPSGLNLGTGTVTLGGNRNVTVAADTLTVGGPIAGAFGLTKLGPGTLTLTAVNTYSGTTTLSAGILQLAGGDNRLSTSGAIAVTGGTLDLGGNSQTTSGAVSFSGLSGLTSGTLTTTNGASLIPTGTLTLGGNAAFVANRANQRLVLGFSAADSLTLSGSADSSLNFGGNDSTAANYVGVDNGSGTLTVDGPTLNFQIGAGQANATGGWFRIGANSGATGLVTLASGTINVGHSASLGAHFLNDAGSVVTSSGTLTIAGGAFNVGTGTTTTTAGGENGYLYLKNNAAGSSGNAIVNLNGGVMAVKRVVAGTGGGTKQLNFNGGTLAAAASDDSFMNAANGFTVNVGNAGGTIDTGTFAITIATPLLAGGNGGITKIGGGTLALSGTNTFSGNTTVAAGILSIGAPSGLQGTSGVILAGGALLRYTGATATFGKDVTVTPGSGVGTIENTGGGTLTLAGTLSKDDSVLRLTGGSFNVTGVITGATPGTSDLVVDAANVTLSNANTYDGPTFVINSGVLTLGVNNAIPATSVVTIGDESSGGTLQVGGYSNAIGGLGFGSAGGTLQISAISTTAASLTAAAGTITLTNGTLDLAGSGYTQGLYHVLSAQSIVGSFADVVNASDAYQLVTTATSVDYQQKAVLGSITVNNPTAAIITGGTAAFTFTVANAAASGGAGLSFFGDGLVNVVGSVSGSAAAGTTSGAIGGLSFVGTDVGAQQGAFMVSAPSAYGVNDAQGIVDVTVLDHATSSLGESLLTSSTISLGTWNYVTKTWESGGNEGLFTIYNLASIYGAGLTADLSLVGVTGTANGFSTNLNTYSDIAGGSSGNYSIFVDPTGFNSSSTQYATFVLSMSDKIGMAGATATNTLYVTAIVATVPEPGAVALGSIGLALVAWSIARRRTGRYRSTGP